MTLSWYSWGPEQAVGKGMLTDQDCVPDCADGSHTSYPATVTLSNPANGVYTRLQEVAGPQGFSTVHTYGSDSWPLSAG